MAGILKESLEGAGIGLLGGLVIGISEADWLRVIIASALIAYAGRALHAGNERSSGGSFRIAFLGITSFLAVLVGLYINGQQLFRQSPDRAVASWVSAGYTPEQARELYLKQLDMEVRKNASPSLPVQTIIQSLANPSASDSLSSGKDSIISRIDSLQAMLGKLMSGGSNTISEKSLISNVAKNLFSSREHQGLCQQLDPDAFPDTVSYFSAIGNTGIDELKVMTIADTTYTSAERYTFSRLLWRLICTLESDTLTHWAAVTDPKTQGYDPEKIHRVYNSQERQIFGQLSEWGRANIKSQEDYFIKINALVRKIAGN